MVQSGLIHKRTRRESLPLQLPLFPEPIYRESAALRPVDWGKWDRRRIRIAAERRRAPSRPLL